MVLWYSWQVTAMTCRNILLKVGNVWCWRQWEYWQWWEVFPCAVLTCDYRKLLVLLLLSKFCYARVCVSARARTHTHTHTHTLPSELLKPSKICTLRFCNTSPYSLDIPPPECLLLGIVRAALWGYSLPVSKKWRNQCMHGLPFSQNFFSQSL